MLAAILMKILASAWGLLAAAAVIIGVLGVIVFLARLSATYEGTLDPHDPFATPFGLHNDGYFSVHHVRELCEVNALTRASGKDGIANVIGFTSPDLVQTEIPAARQTTIFCPQMIDSPNDPVTSVDMILFVAFEARLVPQRFCHPQCFHFVTKTEADGNLHWLQKPMTVPCLPPRSVLRY